MSGEPEKLMNVAELARRLHVGQNMVRKMVKENTIPHLLVGNTARFVWSEVCAALRSQPKVGVA